jgi:hypothetical protein
MVGVKVLAMIATAGAVAVFSQPTAPTTADLPCQAAAGTEEVLIPADSGFVSIFNGTDLKGWWNNCKTEDAQANRQSGGIFRADPVAKAIYSNQRSGGGGSMLVTNHKWGNHEIILELWPDFGNDAGLFHRTNAAGKAYQTVLDYKPNNCIGGSYPQEMESVTGQLFYNCSYFFAGSETTPIKAGTGDAKVDRTKFNWTQMWDPDGWNQLRVKMFGTPPRHQSWMRKSETDPWTLVLDVTWPTVYTNAVGQTGAIGFQIHYGSYWNANSKGNWYRNLRVRELDNNGNPLVTSAAARRTAPELRLAAGSASLSGWLDKAYQVTVRDLSGRKVESFHAAAGAMQHGFGAGAAKGMLLVELRSGAETRALRVVPF